MSYLIQLRQRLKAVGTIKKITGAMRIISRSMHTRMNKQKKELILYQEGIKVLFQKVVNTKHDWAPPFFFPEADSPDRHLYIIVGSQKGLCGNFDLALTQWLDISLDQLKQASKNIVCVGKRTAYLLTDRGLSPLEQFEELKTNTVESITDKIMSHLKAASPFYTQVIFVSSVPKTFFMSHLKEQVLIPFPKPEACVVDADYLWYHSPGLILDKLVHMYLHTSIYNTLFLSLLGEQAARFIAMDNATRNADAFIESMKLQYNKLRQAKITNELTELSASFQEELIGL